MVNPWPIRSLLANIANVVSASGADIRGRNTTGIAKIGCNPGGGLLPNYGCFLIMPSRNLRHIHDTY